jgi:hypothetical protein
LAQLARSQLRAVNCAQWALISAVGDRPHASQKKKEAVGAVGAVGAEWALASAVGDMPHA